jgi:hypothetical protein
MRNGFLRPSALAAAVLFLVAGIAARQESNSHGETRMNCRVIETHVCENPAVVTVIFHQRDKQDQAELASLLVTHSGEKVQVQFGDGEWLDGTVARLKSCFGRGLLFLPSGVPSIKERDTFTLRFAPASQK